MAFPLWKDPGVSEDGVKGGGAGGGEVEAVESGPLCVYSRAGIKMRLEWTKVDGRPGA